MAFNLRDRQILHIAIPSIVSNITVPLLGLIDVAITGHIGDATYIGCVSVGSMIFNVLYWLFAFLRMGTSGTTAQALGRRDLTGCLQQLQRALLISLLLSAAILILQVPLLKLGLAIIAPEPQIKALVHTYYNICVWGAPATLSLFAFNGWFLGMQNTRIPMAVSIMQNVVNILASLFFVFGLGMKIEGVALGTLTAQWAGALASAIFLLTNYGRMRKYLTWEGVFDTKELRRFFSINRDIFIRTLFLVAVNLFFTSAGARQGAVILAVNTIMLQIVLLYSYIMDGFAYAGEALAGRFYGARNKEAFDDTIRQLFKWGILMAIAYTMLFLLAGRSLTELLTTDTKVIECANDYLLWLLLVPAAGMAAFIWDGVFIGITATKGMMISSVIAALLFFALFFALHSIWGNHALWLAMIAYLFTRGFVQSVIFAKKNMFFQQK